MPEAAMTRSRTMPPTIRVSRRPALGTRVESLAPCNGIPANVSLCERSHGERTTAHRGFLMIYRQLSSHTAVPFHPKMRQSAPKGNIRDAIIRYCLQSRLASRQVLTLH
jgi:hypothetical protein